MDIAQAFVNVEKRLFADCGASVLRLDPARHFAYFEDGTEFTWFVGCGVGVLPVCQAQAAVFMLPAVVSYWGLSITLEPGPQGYVSVRDLVTAFHNRVPTRLYRGMGYREGACELLAMPFSRCVWPRVPDISDSEPSESTILA